MTEDAAGSTKETTDSPQGPQHAAPQALQGGDIGAALSRTALAVTLARRRILGPLDPADERDGHGCCHRDRLFAFFVALWSR